MSKPADVSQWAWDEGIGFARAACISEVDAPSQFYALAEEIARSLDAAHAAGKAEQREVVSEDVEPSAWIVRLKYGPDQWSGEMLTDVLPFEADTYEILRALYDIRAFSVLTAERDELVKALEPFSAVGNVISGDFGPALFPDDAVAFDGECEWTENRERKTLTWGDFRSAHATITRIKAS